jgi:hypothetical protein
MYICLLEDGLRPKHVADNFNKIANNYLNRVALDGNPWTSSNTRNRMQTPKFKYINTCITIFDTIHRTVFYSKHSISETAFCLRFLVEPICPETVLYPLGPSE